MKDLQYMNVEKPGKKIDGRASSLDLYCTTDTNEHIVIEIQRHGDEGFIPRSLFYATHVLHEQAEKGDQWEYDFKPTYIIGILEFELIKDGSTEVIRSVRLIDEGTNAVIYPNLTFIYVELPKFDKVLAELETDLDLWLFQFKNLSQLKARPKALDSGIFHKLMILAEMARMTTQERIEYMGRVGAEWKEYTTRQTLHKQGLKEGIEQGENTTMNVLKAYLQQKQSPEQIANALDLPIEKVQAIIDNFGTE